MHFVILVVSTISHRVFRAEAALSISKSVDQCVRVQQAIVRIRYGSMADPSEQRHVGIGTVRTAV